MALHLLIKYITVYLTDFWKTNLTKFAVILTEKALKGRFLKPENSSKITVTKEKERRRRKKKAMVALLVFIMSYFGHSFWPKKGVGRKKSIIFDDNVFKNPARYIQLNMLLHQEQKMFVVKCKGYY